MEIKHLKNIIIISFGFLLLFTAYGGLQALQSSLNPEKGLGVASLSVVYGCLILSSIFLPPIMIKKIGCKWTMVISMCCYITYSIGNFKPNWYSLLITSAILGIGGGPLWASKCTYLTISGITYAKQTGKERMDIVNQYFGLFFLIYQSSGIWGNLISSLVLNQNPNKVVTNNTNYTYCGANNCPTSTEELSNTTTPASGVSETVRYTLMGIYTASGVIAVLLIVIFLDHIDLSEETKEQTDEPTIWNSLLGTLQQLKDIRQCLLIPLTMFSGFQQGFLSSDYTKAYVTCTLGIHFVGYVMICFGATNSISSMVFGKLSQYTGRIALFMLAAAISVSCIIGLRLWSPNPNQLAVFFIFPALWSISDAICQTLLNAFYGVLFDDHKEAAFANYRLWESVGFVIAFAYSNFLCISVKLYVVLSILLIGMILYLVLEYLEYRKQKMSAQETNVVNMTESTTVQNAIG
ncbi:protein unc-93 homolog A-like [Bufo gargarizans]|uniref:protein unc-93 homolog A-like n=1 Tax=Bufo gargarizans TaxID=30331 RepID=UPI001CF49B00|nr:protein unc-93 homolog A-like [Bufo gargarizans]